MSATAALSSDARPAGRIAGVRDVIALTKPSIVLMTLLTAGWGLGLAPGATPVSVILACLVGTALSVGSANAFNMWWERDTDKLMARTRLRPLPDGRMHPSVALVFGLVTAVASVVVLLLWVNLLTTVLSTLAIIVYVLAYTPMKRVTPVALPVGAIAGAMPPLLGWTAATGTLSAPGLLLFGVLFVWQLPHFMAISMFRQAEYERAGIKTVPAVYGDRAARWLIVSTSAALLLVSGALAVTGAAGAVYLFVSCGIGLAITAYALRGIGPGVLGGWSRRYFFATLVYLPALALGMLLDAALT